MWTKSGRGTKLKCMVEISATQNYALVQQLAFFAFVCSVQLLLALRYNLLMTTVECIMVHACSLQLLPPHLPM